MRIRLPAILPVALGACLLACSVHTYPPARTTTVTSGEIYVETPPPPVPNERPPGVAPAGYYWARGRWEWNGRMWVWQPGRWERVRPGYVWVPGYWVRRGRGWLWVPGRYQPR